MPVFYGLKQSGRIAHDELVTHLLPYGYKPSKRTPGLWKHETKPISFILCVDDFGIRYIGENNLQHLQQALKDKYDITQDDTGILYYGLNLKWDYNTRKVELSMLNYVKEALHKFQHPKLTRTQHAPHPWVQKVYGKHQQLVDNPPPLPQPSKPETKLIQQKVGTFLYYARALDDTILTTLNSIGTMQSKPTQATKNKVHHRLYYLSTQPTFVVTYTVSDMILHVDSDASYLVEPGSKSRGGGYYYLSSHKFPKLNGSIHCMATLIKAIMSSAAELELGNLFLNTTNIVSMRSI